MSDDGSGGGGLPLIVLEIVLGFGVPLVWAVWQLVELRRLKRRDEAIAREAEARGEATRAAPTTKAGSDVMPAEASATAASPASTDARSDRG